MKKLRVNLIMLFTIMALLSCSVMSVLVFAEDQGVVEPEVAIDYTLIASSDPATSDITGATDPKKANINKLNSTYKFDKLQENGKLGEGGQYTGGYKSDKYGYSSETSWSLPYTAVLIKLKTPVVASEYTKLTLNIYSGAIGDFCLYSSNAKRFTPETAVGTLNVPTAYKEYGISANASDMAKEDGSIYDLTFTAENIKSAGQMFFKNIVLTKGDGSEVVINFLDRNGIISSDATNPNKVELELYSFDALQPNGWAGAGMGLSTHKAWSKAGTALVVQFKKPINTLLYDKMEFTLYSGLKGKLEVYPSTATKFESENAVASKVMNQYDRNTFQLDLLPLADGDNMVNNITLYLPEDLAEGAGGQLFVGEAKVYAIVTEDIVPEDFVLIASEDPSTSDITAPVHGEDFNANGIKAKYDLEGICLNGTVGEGGVVTGGYKSDLYGYQTEKSWNKPLTATVIKLKTPINASDYKKFTLNIYSGATGDFSLYPSTATRFVRESAVSSLHVDKAYIEYSMNAKATDLAKEDGMIHDFTFAMDNVEAGGQVFFKNIILEKADGSTETINFLDRNGIIESDKTNINKVDLDAYKFDGVCKQSWAEAGMGLNTRTQLGDAQTALVIKFKRPISSAHYDKMEFTLYSGLKGILEVYPASATAFVPSKRVAVKEMEQYTRNTFKLYLKDLADSDGFVRSFTLFLPYALNRADGATHTAGQLFIGEAKVTAKTETSYLDELVLTEGGEQSLTFEGAGEYMTADIPEASGMSAPIDETKALKIKGETTLNFKKVINQEEGQFGNIHMRFYKIDGSPVTKLTFKNPLVETAVQEFDISANKDWFEIVLPIMDYLNNEGNIGSIVVSLDKDGEVIFGGAEVEDKLRIPDKKPAKADISEVLPMEETGYTYTVSEKVDYVPLFENVGMSKNIVTFKVKVSDLSDFNLMFTLSGAGKETNGIWFWFDKNGVNMIGGQRNKYPEGVKANEWMEVEIGAIPYTVNFMPYGVRGYMKLNGTLMLEKNIDASVQPTGKWFGCYVHQTNPGTVISIAPVNYTKTEVISLERVGGDVPLNIGDNDKIVVNRNIELNGQEISEITVVSGDSVTIDGTGFIEAVKSGTTVFKVVVSGVGVIPEKEYTLSVEANKFCTVKLGSKSVQVKEGEKLTLPELTPPQEGLEFAGLFLDKECQNKFDYENTPITEDITLYVGWQKPQPQQSVEAESGCNCGSSIMSLPALSVAGVLAMLSYAIINKKKRG